MCPSQVPKLQGKGFVATRACETDRPSVRGGLGLVSGDRATDHQPSGPVPFFSPIFLGGRVPLESQPTQGCPCSSQNQQSKDALVFLLEIHWASEGNLLPYTLCAPRSRQSGQPAARIEANSENEQLIDLAPGSVRNPWCLVLRGSSYFSSIKLV